MSEMVLEQYQCETCRRFFYINKGDKSRLDIAYGCPYGCDDAGRHIRTLTVVEKLIDLECHQCNRVFTVQRDYEGTITCPYCGNLVEY